MLFPFATLATLPRTSILPPTEESAPRTVEFSGRRWRVGDSGGKAEGPGPNLFSDDPKSVFVDARGRLHLRIRREGSRWLCSGIYGERPLGHGTYRFHLGSRVDRLDPNVVVGLFTYGDAQEFAHRELDFEFTRWGDPNRSNGQLLIQPWDRLGNMVRFEMPPEPRSVHEFEWLPQSAAFTSRTPSGRLLAEHVFTEAIPPAGDEVPMMNLWLFNAKPPRDGRTVEVVIERFEFVPAPAGQLRTLAPVAQSGPDPRAGGGW